MVTIPINCPGFGFHCSETKHDENGSKTTAACFGEEITVTDVTNLLAVLGSGPDENGFRNSKNLGERTVQRTEMFQ